MNQIVDAVKPTLGPTPRLVGIERTQRGDAPEILDNAGVIARRIVALPGRDEDVGAMFVRHLLWRLHEQAGDGTATAAVVFQSIFNQSLRYIAAGGNAMRMRQCLEQGMRRIHTHLDSMTLFLDGKTELAHLAESICSDPPLAAMLGEIFDIIGEHGQLDIRIGRGDQLEREYVEGMYWKSGVLARTMLTDQVILRTDLENAALLISDLEIDNPRDLAPLLELAVRTETKALVVVAKRLSDSAVAMLLRNQNGTERQYIAVKTPGFGAEEQSADLQDMAVLTGGRPLFAAAGAALSRVTHADLGHARRAWASSTDFGIAGGKGDPRQLRMLVADLRAGFARTTDAGARENLRRRLGKLLGGSATLRVSASTPSELEARKALAERTARALRGATLEGVVPGGGAALLACRDLLLRHREASSNPDERLAYRILGQALETPIRTIIANAGYDPATVLAEVDRAGNGYGFDARSGAVVEMVAAGIFDAASVQKAAMHGAVAGAALAITIDVLIHRRRPEESIEP